MVELVPREILFGNPERLSPAISPDGGSLAWLAPCDGVLNVWVAPIGPGGVDWPAARAVTDDRGAGIREFTWTPGGAGVLYLQDTDGDEAWRLYDVDLRSGTRRNLTPFPGVQARIVAIRRAYPDEIVVGLNRDDAQLHDAYRLSLATGELTLIARNLGYSDWLVDEQLTVRGAFASLPDGAFDLLVRDDGHSTMRRLLTVPADEAPFINALSFAGDGKSLLLISAADANTGRLVRLDLVSGATEVIVEDPTFDVCAAVLHPETRDPQIVTVLRERADHRVLDPSIEADVLAIRGLHPGDFELVGRDDEDQTWMIAFTDDVEPVQYHVFDRRTGKGRLLFRSRPELSRYELARTEPFSYTARDGLTIHGYVTFPPGQPRKDLPTVLNVHGGPRFRDVWGFHPGAQWLANRGYLCVQVNFRGSTGYGRDFVAAGDREWGGKMQDDLIDAVGHVVDQGWADRHRVAIYGGSYGGYAALAGAAFTPDVFACAVDVVGPSNLKTFLESLPPYWAPMAEQWYRQIGHPITDEEFLWSRSPLSRVADIRIPLLIAQGANDPRVKQSESEQIVAALTNAGIEHEYLLFPDEGHGFARPENRLRFYRAAEHFLARHLGGQVES